MNSTPLNISEQEYLHLAQHDPDLALKLTQAVFRMRRDAAGGQPLAGGAQGETAACPFLDMWLPMGTLADALKVRPPTTYLVDGLLPLPSLAMIYGPPGSMKSMLLMDLALSVASGQSWLPQPGEALNGQLSALISPEEAAGGQGPGGFGVRQGNVFWLDLDQGQDIMAERLAALARARGVGAACEALLWKSFPGDGFSLLDKVQVGEMILRMQAYHIRLLCIDNLATAKGAADENSGDMITVLTNLRVISEQAKATVVLLHHTRKETGFKSGRTDLARGHSSILAGLDLALGIERDEQSLDIVLRVSKCRRNPVRPFGGQFSFTHRPQVEDLWEARFWGRPAFPDGGDGDGRRNAQRIEQLEQLDREIMAAVQGGRMNQLRLVYDVRRRLKKAPINRIRMRLDELVADGRLRVEVGAKNAHWYTLPAPQEEQSHD